MYTLPSRLFGNEKKMTERNRVMRLKLERRFSIRTMPNYNNNIQVDSKYTARTCAPRTLYNNIIRTIVLTRTYSFSELSLCGII